MSFGPKPPSFSDEEKNYLRFLAATTVLTVVITKTVDVMADEFKEWLQRRRDAQKKAQETKTS